MEKSTEFILQGYAYLLETEKTIVRTQVTLRDPINVDLLQQSLDAVMSHTDYFNVKLICEEEQFFLTPNEIPCEIYSDSVLRQIPEETNGYLFYVSYQASTVFFTFWHFITDGRGSIRFMNELTREYCNRRYGTKFVCNGLYTDPAFSLEALKDRYGKVVSSGKRQNIPRIQNKEPRRYLIRISSDSVSQAAMAENTWPFIYVLYVLCRMVRDVFDEEKISFCYPVDSRDVVGVPNALYNCVYMDWILINSLPEEKESMLDEICESVIQNMKMDERIMRFIQCHQVFQTIHQAAKPLRTKKTQFNVLQRFSKAHLLLTYLDDPMRNEQIGLDKYIDDYQIACLTASEPLLISELTWGGFMNIGISSRLGNEKIADRICEFFTHENIEVCAIEALNC